MQGKPTINAKLTRRSFVAGAALSALALAGCSSNSGGSSSTNGSGTNSTAGSNSTGGQSGTTSSDGLTMLTSSSNYQKFSEGLTAKYPEVKLDMISYIGYDTTDYIQAQMRAEQCPDIVVNTYPNPDELQKANLIDLSGEDFTNTIRMKLLDDVTIDGGVYLIPSNVSMFGCYYNKTLFDAHGWTVPNSLAELEALIPQIEAAGVTLAEVTSTLPGTGFALFWDILAPEFTSTLDGMRWMKQFLAGEAKATGTLEPYAATFERWKSLGMLKVDPAMQADSEATNRFKEGNTAFLTTVSNQKFAQNDDGTGDQYRMMPWLSSDGSNNIIVTNVTRYYGINKALEEDSDKKEKALKLMDYLCTSEGQQTLVTASNTITPLKNDAVAEDDPLHDLAALVDEGKSMAMVYSGWENFVADMGAEVLEYLKDNISMTELLARFDSIQERVLATGGLETYGECSETLSLQQVAQLVGTAFAKAANTDCALISIGGFHDFGKENKYGCNGYLYENIPIDKNIVCSINPLGWKQFIKTGQLTGEQIKKWTEEGFFTLVENAATLEDSEPFEYLLIAPEGTELEDSKTYTVALVNEREERATECGMTATELVGQDVLIDYISEIGTVNSETIAWK